MCAIIIWERSHGGHSSAFVVTKDVGKGIMLLTPTTPTRTTITTATPTPTPTSNTHTNNVAAATILLSLILLLRSLILTDRLQSLRLLVLFYLLHYYCDCYNYPNCFTATATTTAIPIASATATAIATATAHPFCFQC